MELQTDAALPADFGRPGATDPEPHIDHPTDTGIDRRVHATTPMEVPA